MNNAGSTEGSPHADDPDARPAVDRAARRRGARGDRRSLALGSSGLDAPWAGLTSGDPLTRTIVWELRLPRALAAFGAGACSRSRAC